MKKRIILFSILGWAFPVFCQFVPQPLNYPGTGYWPYMISIADPLHVWVGTYNESGLPCGFAAKTTNGGTTWSFDSIPVSGVPFCQSTFAWDSNTCYFSFYDNSSGSPSLWKTNDGGSYWMMMTTTQFSGGFLNFYHGFTADTGVAVGDPNGGFFEIYQTFDAGNTWTRVPESNIPAPLTGEWGYGDTYSAVGNSIWFATSKGRCFFSSDRGSTWNVSEVINNSPNCDVCFATELKGAFWSFEDVSDYLFITNNGGVTWDTVFLPGFLISRMSAVRGFEAGFIFTALTSSTCVYFTPDHFANTALIASDLTSNMAISFYDSVTGWIGGGETGSNEILKYNEALTSVNSISSSAMDLLIFPNPATDKYLIRLPERVHSGTFQIMDISGKNIDQGNIGSDNWISRDARTYGNGIYTILIRTDSGRYTGKLVVQH